jgi:excisionase family DNA binding protein
VVTVVSAAGVQRTVVIQAAKTLAVSRPSIYQLVWNEQLVPIRIGRSVRFSIDDIEDFAARRSTEGSR